MIARLSTEHKNYSRLVKLCASYFDGFSIVEAEGYWKGKPESSLIIEIARTGREKDFLHRVSELAKAIRDLNKQDAVLVEFIHSENLLI